MHAVTNRYTHAAEPHGYHVHLPPLTLTRLENIAERHGEDYTSDDLGVYFSHDNIDFSLYLHGPTKEVLIVRSDHSDDFPPYASRKRIREEVDKWNQNYMWPKAYTHHCSGGHLHVYGEMAMDYRLGVTDNQVSCHIATVVANAEQMYEEIRRGVQ